MLSYIDFADIPKIITSRDNWEFFEPYLKEGKDIVYLSLSSGLSNTFNSVCLAIESTS